MRATIATKPSTLDKSGAANVMLGPSIGDVAANSIHASAVTTAANCSGVVMLPIVGATVLSIVIYIASGGAYAAATATATAAAAVDLHAVTSTKIAVDYGSFIVLPHKGSKEGGVGNLKYLSVRIFLSVGRETVAT